MGLFKKKRPQVTHEKVAGRIAERLISKQAQLASYLNQKIGRCTAKTLAFWLIGFCLVFGGYCLYLVASAFN